MSCKLDTPKQQKGELPKGWGSVGGVFKFVVTLAERFEQKVIGSHLHLKCR